MNARRADFIQWSLGDITIDSLLKGILAGTGMLLYLIIAGIFLGDDPVLVLTRFSPDGGSSPLSGLLVHLGVSAIYGAAFGLVRWTALGRRQAMTPRWSLLLTGLVFGLALWLLAQFLLVPGTGSRLAEFAMGHLAMAHLVYGAALGFLADRPG